MLYKIVIALALVTVAHGQGSRLFNSNPRQQDHSGGLNFQLDTTGNSHQYIGPGGGGAAGARPQGGGAGFGGGGFGGDGGGFGGGFNSNPRQQDYSGGAGNVQIDTTGNSRQVIGGGGYTGGYGGGPGAGPAAGVGGGFGGGGPARVNVDGVDYTNANVQRPGLHINQRPY